MNEKPSNSLSTDVLIVGAGPVGMALALEIAVQGHRCILVEKVDRLGVAPRAKTTNVRTREIFRRWGIADRLAEASPFGLDYPSEVVFATRLAGIELARFSNAMYCSPQRDERFSEHAQWIPQYKVEAVLRAQLEEFTNVVFLTNTEFIGYEEVNSSISSKLHFRNSSKGIDVIHVESRFLVGADGARSTVREQLGIQMEGVSPLSKHTNIVFKAPGLADSHPLGPAIMYWLVNDDAPATVSPLDADDRWTYGCRWISEPEPDLPKLIRKSLGLDLDIEILSRDDWTAHQLIAASYRSKSVFLVGDACHLHPPYGGFGMNMGIGDALDLGWKISAVLDGWGGTGLLDSYEEERKQIHRRTVDEAVKNLATTSFSLSIPDLETVGPIGDYPRSQVKTRILEAKRPEFDSLGVILGSRYRSSVILPPEPIGGFARDSEAIAYLPQVAPGCLLPHAWLESNSDYGSSIFDHIANQGLTLLSSNSALTQSVEIFAAAAEELKIPLKVISFEEPKISFLYEGKLVLIRPDHYIAWCGADAQDAMTVLRRAAGLLPFHSN